MLRRIASLSRRRDADHGSDHADADLHEFDQIDRMANPLLSTALIPTALKDAFNVGQPKNDAHKFESIILGRLLALDQQFGTCPTSATSAAACNPNARLLTSILVPDTLKFAANVPDGYPNGRQLADRVTDVLISLFLQVPGFTDGTSSKTYCSQFPFLGPPIQIKNSAPFGASPQTCP